MNQEFYYLFYQIMVLKEKQDFLILKSIISLITDKADESKKMKPNI